MRRREILRGAALKAALAERDAAASKAAAENARHAEARKAATIAEKARQDALNPPQGWWRKKQKGDTRALRYDALAAALSLGCTNLEIARASGARANVVEMAARNLRKKPALAWSDARLGRDWTAILAAAASAGLTVRDVAGAEGVSRNTVRDYARRRGFVLKKRWQRSALVTPRAAESDAASVGARR